MHRRTQYSNCNTLYAQILNDDNWIYFSRFIELLIFLLLFSFFLIFFRITCWYLHFMNVNGASAIRKKEKNAFVFDTWVCMRVRLRSATKTSVHLFSFIAFKLVIYNFSQHYVLYMLNNYKYIAMPMPIHWTESNTKDNGRKM